MKDELQALIESGELYGGMECWVFPLHHRIKIGKVRLHKRKHNPLSNSDTEHQYHLSIEKSQDLKEALLKFDKKK